MSERELLSALRELTRELKRNRGGDPSVGRYFKRQKENREKQIAEFEKRVNNTGLRWMLFVDGENLTIRFQATAMKKFGNDALSGLDAGCFRKNVFVWADSLSRARQGIPKAVSGRLSLRPEPVHRYYYTSVQGDDTALKQVQDSLSELGFIPVVFKKTKGSEKAKGVDIALTKDLLSNAFLGNYDAAILFSGDADYYPVIDEVNRLGKSVYVFAFEDGFSPLLQYRCVGWRDPWEYFEPLCQASQVEP